MKNEFTLGQLLAVGVTIILAIVTGWITMSNKVATVEAENRELRNNLYSLQISVDKKFEKIDSKLDDNNSTLFDIKVLLERKADRKWL